MQIDHPHNRLSNRLKPTQSSQGPVRRVYYTGITDYPRNRHSGSLNSVLGIPGRSPPPERIVCYRIADGNSLTSYLYSPISRAASIITAIRQHSPERIVCYRTAHKSMETRWLRTIHFLSRTDSQPDFPQNRPISYLYSRSASGASNDTELEKLKKRL
jgi:hypothetical protein